MIYRFSSFLRAWRRTSKNWQKENSLDLVFKVIRLHHFSRSYFVFGIVVAYESGEAEIVIKTHPKSVLYTDYKAQLKEEVLDFFSKIKARIFYDDKFERLFFYEFKRARTNMFLIRRNSFVVFAKTELEWSLLTNGHTQFLN